MGKGPVCVSKITRDWFWQKSIDFCFNNSCLMARGATLCDWPHIGPVRFHGWAFAVMAVSIAPKHHFAPSFNALAVKNSFLASWSCCSSTRWRQQCPGLLELTLESIIKRSLPTLDPVISHDWDGLRLLFASMVHISALTHAPETFWSFRNIMRRVTFSMWKWRWSITAMTHKTQIKELSGRVPQREDLFSMVWLFGEFLFLPIKYFATKFPYLGTLSFIFPSSGGHAT